MSDLTLYHNPRCSKSRQTLALLEQAGHSPKIVEYLKTPLDHALVKGLLSCLDMPARAVLRRGEAPYRELRLADESLSDDALIQAIVDHPILLERPIVVRGDRAVIGRPPENVRQLLD